MLKLSFSGWLQCRLATDPDPTDDPRGVSGWTYALAGEPDLDRVIRTQPLGAIIRAFGPTVDVRVRRVVIGEQEIDRHPLQSAAVILLSDGAFEGRNGIASEDTEEPIFPFHLRVETGSIRLEREFRNISTGEWKFQKSDGIEANNDAVREAGIDNPDELVARRIASLQDRLAQTADSLERLQLQTRLRHLAARGFGPVPAFIGLRYRYTLDGPWLLVSDPQHELAGTVGSSAWVFTAWIGCWDGDALCGFMTGELTMPFVSRVFSLV
jgi:hypothetical protein